MKTSILPIALFLFITLVAKGQEYDTADIDYDTAYSEYDSTYAGEDYSEEAYESTSADATFTIADPAQLEATKDNNKDTYARHNFDEKKWKDIVGETSYTEKKIEEKKESNSFTPAAPIWSGSILKIIGFGLIFAIAITVLYFLVKNTFANEFISKDLKINDPLLFDNHIEEVSDQDIEALLKRALANTDFRAAVRLYYIRLLKHLHNTQFIAWKKDKTNRDYSYELSTTPLVGGFQKVTLAYEVIWYGERTPTSKEFETLQRNFGDLHNLTGTVHEK